jgi:hypothetical protein
MSLDCNYQLIQASKLPRVYRYTFNSLADLSGRCPLILVMPIKFWLLVLATEVKLNTNKRL